MAGLMGSGGGHKLVRVYLGDVNIFYGGTINVASSLPDLYKKLTIDNFAIEPKASYVAWNFPDGNSRIVQTFSKSYDPNSGTLSMSAMGCYFNNRLNGGLTTVSVYALYIK